MKLYLTKYNNVDVSEFILFVDQRRDDAFIDSEYSRFNKRILTD